MSPLKIPNPLALDKPWEPKKYYTILNDSSFRGRRVFSPSGIRARNLRDHFHPIFCSHQKGFAKAPFHLVDFANRSSISGKRHDDITQFFDVKLYASLQELLLLVRQEPAVRIIKERISADRLTFLQRVRRMCVCTGECSPRHEKESLLTIEAVILRFLRTCLRASAKTARIAS